MTQIQGLSPDDLNVSILERIENWKVIFLECIEIEKKIYVKKKKRFFLYNTIINKKKL